MLRRIGLKTDSERTRKRRKLVTLLLGVVIGIATISPVDIYAAEEELSQSEYSVDEEFAAMESGALDEGAAAPLKEAEASDYRLMLLSQKQIETSHWYYHSVKDGGNLSGETDEEWASYGVTEEKGIGGNRQFLSAVCGSDAGGRYDSCGG
ncbi:MAG: hypothetical protein IJT16_10950 [Lachnospiraceae bacterium]|nr:hypothetical protein [Lachnospiraceae bacterium]